MSTPQATIKVPKDLRNRIAARAEAQHVTFATAIEQALDAAEDRAFWEAITRHNPASKPPVTPKQKTSAQSPPNDSLTISEPPTPLSSSKHNKHSAASSTSEPRQQPPP